MNPKRMKEIKGRLDNVDGCCYQTDVADLLKELCTYQLLILNLLNNLKDWKKGNPKFLLEKIEGTLTVVARTHDFLGNKFNQPVSHNCKVSTGICGSLTFGTGELDNYGYWEKPCLECAKAWREQYPEETWPKGG